MWMRLNATWRIIHILLDILEDMQSESSVNIPFSTLRPKKQEKRK